MYRNHLQARDKGGAIIGVVAIHAGLLAMLLQLSGRVDLTDPQSALRVFDILDPVPPPEPPPPPPPPPRQQETPRPKEPEGGSSPENIRSQATPIVAPKPRVELPVPPKIATSETPRDGTDATQGASDVRGLGTGSGGSGTGTGSGAGGGGPGGGGGGGVAVRPRIVRQLSNRDYPAAIQARWPRGGRIDARVRVEPNGRASACDVQRSYGDRAADDITCRLIMERAVFEPARDAQGRPVASWYGYSQSDRPSR